MEATTLEWVLLTVYLVSTVGYMFIPYKVKPQFNRGQLPLRFAAVISGWVMIFLLLTTGDAPV